MREGGLDTRIGEHPAAQRQLCQARGAEAGQPGTTGPGGTVLRRLNPTGELLAGVMRGRATRLHTEQKRPPRQSQKEARRLKRGEIYVQLSLKSCEKRPSCMKQRQVTLRML